MKYSNSSSAFLVIFLLVIGGLGYTYYKNNPTMFAMGKNIGIEQPVTLAEGEEVKLYGSDLKIKVLELKNEPCIGVCFNSGVGAMMQYSRGEQVKEGFNLNRAFGYKIKVLDTDNVNFLTFKVEVE